MEKIKFLLKLVFTLAVLGGCFALVDIDALKNALSMTDPLYLAITFVTTVIGSIIVPGMLAWYALPEGRLDLSLGRLIMINFSLRFYMLVLPRPIVLVMRWLRYKQGGSGIDALALMVFVRLVQMAVYSFTAVLLLGMQVDSLPDYSHYIWLAAVVVWLLALLAIAPFFSARANRLLVWFVTIADRVLPAFLKRILLKLLDAVAAFQGLTAGRILIVLACSLTSYVLLIAGSYVLMQTMDFTLSLQDLAWIRSLILIITQIPVTVGGIGLREAGFIGLLHMYGVAEHDALAYSLLFLFIHLLIGLVGAASEIVGYVRRVYYGPASP